jgi:hypothetical protein
MNLGAEAKITVGTPDTLLESTVAAGERSVIFEDDGTTGYFYAVRPGAELEMLDALHVYDVANVTDRQIPVTVQIFWDEAESAAVLLINGRNAFPPARNEQTLKRELTDELIEQYFAA